MQALQAQHFADLFNVRLARTAARTQSDAAAAKETVDALKTYDSATIASQNQRLTQLISAAERVDIIPKGKAEVDLNAKTPISFAALDVIKRAETQEYVGPEASQVNQRSVFYAAKPITDAGTVTGVLFAAISMDYFSQPLKLLPEDRRSRRRRAAVRKRLAALGAAVWRRGRRRRAEPRCASSSMHLPGRWSSRRAPSATTSVISAIVGVDAARCRDRADPRRHLPQLFAIVPSAGARRHNAARLRHTNRSRARRQHRPLLAGHVPADRRRRKPLCQARTAGKRSTAARLSHARRPRQKPLRPRQSIRHPAVKSASKPAR